MFNSIMQHTDFQLPANTTPEWKSGFTTLTPMTEQAKPLSGGARDEKNNPSFNAKASPAVPTTGSGGGITSHPHDDRKAPRKQLIVVRLTYYMIDEQNPFYAFRFAESLQQKHPDVEVVMLLEKEGTRCANKDLNTNFIMRNEKVAHKLSDLVTGFLQKGGRVVVSRDWANAFGVTEANMIQGVQLCDNDAIGDLVVDASKILEY